MRFVIVLALGLLLAACETVSTTPTTEGKADQPQAKTIAVPVVAPLPHMTQAWTKKLLAELRLQMKNLDTAEKDMKRFCPKYSEMSNDERVVAWGHLAAAIIFFESGVDKKGLAKTCSSMTETSGVDSIGFFQLSYGDSFCPANKRAGNLCDPDVNITCGVRILGARVSLDKKVAGGGYVSAGASAPQGAARYWSVVRVADPKPRYVKGQKVQKKHHLAEIIALAKKAPGCL